MTNRKKQIYTIASFFGGVGGIDLGFEQTKHFKTIYINEFDKYAQETILTNFPEVTLDRRDIHDVKDIEVPNTDIIVGGFPCQAFSIAGYRKGFEDERGDLFFELLRMITHHKPKSIFIENVKNMVTHDNGKTFKIIREALTMNGYYIKWKVINSKDYGNIPQNRERIYIVGFTNKKSFNRFKFPEAIDMNKTLDEFIDFDSKEEEKYYYRKGVQPFYNLLEESVKDKNTVYQWRRQYVRENKSGVVPTLTANMGTGGHNVPIVLTKYGIRKLTPRETFNVQGFPKEFKLPDISNGQLYKQAGNSVVVPVINRIAENIFYALSIDDIDHDGFDEKHNKQVIYVNLKGRFEGESYLEDMKKDIDFLSDEEYFKIIKKNINKEFYSLISE